MLAGREGNGTVMHFLGSTRNSQGELLTLALLYVCVPLSVSPLLLAFFSLSLCSCLQPSLGESITKQVEVLVSATSHGG